MRALLEPCVAAFVADARGRGLTLREALIEAALICGEMACLAISATLLAVAVSS